jgi:hypothetical protein
MRAEVESVHLAVDAHVNVLIETARGLYTFGRRAEADQTLSRAETEASAHGFDNAMREASAVRAQQVAKRNARPVREAVRETEAVASDLRQMAAALATVG